MNIDGQAFVFLSATTFDTCLSGRTRRLTEALARQGHDVTFVEMPSVRQLARPRTLLDRTFVTPCGVRVLRVPPLPWRLRSGWPRLTAAWADHVAHTIQRLVNRLDRAALVTSTPWWLSVVDRLPVGLRCYDYLDHVDVQAGPARVEVFRRWDSRLLAGSDLVTTVSEPLRRHLDTPRLSGRLHLLPNGVCGDWIDAPAAPVERATLSPRPDAALVGFVGALFEWVDAELIAEVALLLPEVDFAIVGPTRRGVKVDPLQGLTNVHCHGPVPFDRVPAVIAALDVCLIPFKRDLISEYADPLKVYEYCALGKPVISTVLFNAGGTEPPITVAVGPESFTAAIRGALNDPPDRRQRRIDFARRHTWEARATRFVQLVEETHRLRGGS